MLTVTPHNVQLNAKNTITLSNAFILRGKNFDLLAGHTLTISPTIAIGSTIALNPNYANIDCSKCVVLPGLVNLLTCSMQQYAQGITSCFNSDSFASVTDLGKFNHWYQLY